MGRSYLSIFKREREVERERKRRAIKKNSFLSSGKWKIKKGRVGIDFFLSFVLFFFIVRKAELMNKCYQNLCQQKRKRKKTLKQNKNKTKKQNQKQQKKNSFQKATKRPMKKTRLDSSAIIRSNLILSNKYIVIVTTRSRDRVAI